jgi:predicted metalloprotease
MFGEKYFRKTICNIKPKLILFTGLKQCGSATTGTFYCPADQKKYMDLTFFYELKTRFGHKEAILQQHM